ncbi:MAG: hypothetical protein KatS3mg023_3878 [Armatimonadota bacterium]|nr:MAG: hypothetical protein KatS3mg023_3878 [Armatimonadota bacterium]
MAGSKDLLFRPSLDTWMPESVYVDSVHISKPTNPPASLSAYEMLVEDTVKVARLMDLYGYPKDDITHLTSILLPHESRYGYEWDDRFLYSGSVEQLMLSSVSRLYREAVYSLYDITSDLFPASGYAEFVAMMLQDKPTYYNSYAEWTQNWITRIQVQEAYRSDLRERMDRAMAKGIRGLREYSESRLRYGIESSIDRFVVCMVHKARDQGSLRRIRDFLVKLRTMTAVLLSLWQTDVSLTWRKLDDAFVRIITDYARRSVLKALNRVVDRVVDEVESGISAVTSSMVRSVAGGGSLAECFDVRDLGLADVMEFLVDGIEDIVYRYIRHRNYYDTAQTQRLYELRKSMEQNHKIDKARRVLAALDVMITAIDRIMYSASAMEIQMAMDMIVDAYRKTSDVFSSSTPLSPSAMKRLGVAP